MLTTSKSFWTAVLPIKATPKGRPRASRTGIFYTPKKTRDAEKELKTQMLALSPPKLSGPLCMYLTFNFTKPKSAQERKHPCVRPDLDNLGKLVLDAANGILYEDDAQICHLTKVKAYAEEDSIKIVVFKI